MQAVDQNSDHPPPVHVRPARDPPPFLDAEISRCVRRRNVRVYAPEAGQAVVAAVVVVPVVDDDDDDGGEGGRSGGGGAAGESGGDGGGGGDASDEQGDDEDVDSDASSVLSDFSSDDEGAETLRRPSPLTSGVTVADRGGDRSGRDEDAVMEEVRVGVDGGGTGSEEDEEEDEGRRAYWLTRTLKEAIYGRVAFAIVLRARRKRGRKCESDEASPPDETVEWEVTEERCAVKEMLWARIVREGDRLTEDPRKEVQAMQHMQRWLQREIAAGQNVTMMEAHVIMPLDALSDGRFLYSIMPFCNGGEVFDLLQDRRRFSEDEARELMLQILSGLESMQNAGIHHRDVSLENLIIHNDTCLHIDMGQCLRVPYEGIGEDGAAGEQPLQQRFRCLIAPQEVNPGKLYCRAPEIHSTRHTDNADPFDGFAVDMWAAGVVLFVLLTGFNPWDQPIVADDRFRLMTSGYLPQILTEWDNQLNIGFSENVKDLLQNMFWRNPRERLSLAQVLAHPWFSTH